MPDVKVLSRVQVSDPKFEGSGVVVYKMGAWVIIRDDSNNYHPRIPLSSVLSIEAQSSMANRESLLKAFEDITVQRDITQTMISSNSLGFLSYYKSDGKSMVSFKFPEGKDNQELWLVTSFNLRDKLEIPSSDAPRDIEIRHLRPFETKSEIFDEGRLIGRDRDKEATTLYDRLETLLATVLVKTMNPFKGVHGRCQETIKTVLGKPPTWIFDGDEMFDTLPSNPGLYLCGNKGTGRITRLAGTDKVCAYVDSRLSVVVKVLSHE